MALGIHGLGIVMEAKRSNVRVFQERTNTPVTSVFSELKQESTLEQPMDAVKILPVASTQLSVDDTKKSFAPYNYGISNTSHSSPPGGLAQPLTFPATYSPDEGSAQELQIQVLQKAAALLLARVINTGENVVKLKKLLANRKMDPAEYRYLQCQRWIEERRLVGLEEFSMAVQEDSSDFPSSSTRGLPLGQSSDVKLDTNFVNFLENSRQLAPIRGGKGGLRKDSTKEDKVSSLRIHRHQTLLPLALPSQRCSPLADTLKLRSKLEMATSSTNEATPPRYSTPTLNPFSSAFALSPMSHVESLSDVSTAPPLSPLPTDMDGTATIWRESLIRSKTEIMADLVVSMPDYVSDLLAKFDSAIPDCPSELQLSGSATANSQNLKTKTSKTTFKVDDAYPRRSEQGPSANPSTFPRLHRSPSKKRLSALLSFPDALSSRISLKSAEGRASDRSSWRLSSPPSAFPSNFARNSAAPTIPSFIPPNPIEMENISPKKISAVSFSDLRLASKSASTASPSTTSPLTPAALPEVQEQPLGAFSRFRRRMSVLQRS